MTFDRIHLSDHALEKMIERYLTEADIRRVLEEGVRVEEYPDDLPYPAQLMLGYVDGRPLHVVAADDADGRQTIVVTLYEPSRTKWDATFRKRKRQ